MKNRFQLFFLTILIYFSVCASTIFFITPYAFTSFIGPAAGITTALVVAFGTSVFLAITVATILFCLYLFFSLNITLELSMSIITLLAIILQSFWAKQLTLNEINKDKWLKSRRFLLFFLFKIGPLTSLVSAFTVIIVATLESEILGENLFFTFVSGWSGSVLVSIFFTPVFLLCRGEQQLTLSKRVFIIIASFLAFITIGVLFKISQNFQQHERQDIFKQVKYQVVEKIKNEIKITMGGLNSLSAFFRSNNNVGLREFNLFTKQVFHHESSVRVLEWAPIINHNERIAFEKKHNVILDKSVGGITEKASERSYYAPIHYFYPYLGNEAIIGLDVLTNENQIISMDEVVRSKQVIASSPINLIQDNHTNLGVLFASAVFSYSTENNVTNSAIDSTSDLLGFVIAVAQFKPFFEQISPLKTDNIDLLIEDVTSTVPFILFGKELNKNYRHVESIDIQVNTRQWRISLGEHQPWQLQQKNSQVWDILIGATFGGILFQILILMMVVYSNELSFQVVKRTRELIIAKEQSEKKNAAKTNFIHALSNELQTPLHAINNFSQQFEKANNNDKNKIIKNIQLAQQNMKKLLHMLDDLSKIESGKSEVDIKPFDFYGFLGRIDDMLLAKKLSDHNHNSITFLIDSNVPPFINSDELRLQQFLIVFCEEVHKLFNCKKIRLTVKVHFHHLNSATLLFVFTNHDETTNNEAPFNNFINSDIAFYSTQMAMAKEVCQLMNGDANLAISDSGERVLTASIKILITSIEQQYAYQSDIFIETEDK
jgi:CHASE1-domain containing sensor protein